MSTSRVKICGLTTATDRDSAIAAGADALGFISQVSVETPREITATEARDLITGVPPFVTSVLVTMPESVEKAVTLQETAAADAIQIHGTLSPNELDVLTDRLDIPVIAAVDVAESNVGAYANVADAVLVDSTSEEGGGGTGRTHDWERTREIKENLSVPLVLAGGLTPENVRQAIETVEPFAVDTASGVEREGGRKDTQAIHDFVEAAHQRSTNTASQQGRTV